MVYFSCSCFVFLLIAVLGVSWAFPKVNMTGELNNTDSNNYSEEIARQKRLEFVMVRILEELHLSKVPRVRTNNLPPKEIRDMLRKESEQRTDIVKKMIKAEDVDLQCSGNRSECLRFQYVIPAHLNIQELELRLKKTENNSSVLPTASITLTTQKNNSAFEFEVRLKHGNVGDWLKIILPQERIRHFRHKAIICIVEINGMQTEIIPEEHPFLLLSSVLKPPIRNRREVTGNCVPNSNCCLASFPINFVEDIGWDWIIEPTEFDAKICMGHCPIDSNKGRNQYERVVMEYAMRNPNFANSAKACNLRLALHCTHSSLENLLIAYLDDDQNYSSKSIPNLIAKSCTCT